MGIVIKIPYNAFKDVEKRLSYKFWDKGRERSNRAAAMMASGRIAARCILRHDQFAYTGPPDDKIRAYVCLRCHAAACEPEIIDMGSTFDECTLELIHHIMDLDLARQGAGNPKQFGMYAGR